MLVDTINKEAVPQTIIRGCGDLLVAQHKVLRCNKEATCGKHN